jgi:hypothetical protein
MAWSLALSAHGRAAMEQLGLIEEQQLAVAAHLTFLVGLGEVSAELGGLDMGCSRDVRVPLIHRPASG